MKSNIDALNTFINKAKKSYKGLDTAQKWGADKWASKGFLEGTDENASLHFTKYRKSKHTNAGVITNKSFIDLCKALAVNNAQRKVFKTLQCNLNYMKYLHRALLQAKGSAEPWLLDDAVLEQLESSLVASDYTDIAKMLAESLKLITQLKTKGIISVGITFTHTHKAKLIKEQKELNYRRKKAQSIDDNERDHEDKLISMKGLNALVWLTFNATNEWEQVAIRYYHILMVTGFRISELLRLRHDALVSVHELSETTGKPIFIEKRDGDGNLSLDENGKPELEPQMIWAIQYHPEKGHVAVYKWLDRTSAPLVIAAFEYINKQTEKCREQLKWLEENPNKPIRWKSKTITYRELNKHFITFSSKPTNMSIGTYTYRLKKAGVFAVNTIVDKARVTAKNRTRRPPKLAFFSVDDFNRHYYQDHKTSIRFQVGDKGKRKKLITIKKSELLCIAPSGAFANPKTTQRVFHIYPNVVERSIGSVFGGGSPEYSIFNRYDLKEEDGSDIHIMTHMPRHQLNTFLALADVAEHQQALIIGRSDIEQNRSYQHLSLKDKTKFQQTSTDSMRQRVERAQSTKQIVATPETEDSLLAELGVAPMGPTPTKLAVQQSAHAFNKPDEHVEFMKEALEQDNLLGELQDTFNQIRKNEGLQAAKDFIELHGRNFHIVVNGSCTRNVALHGCDKQLRCLDGEGCFHLSITGRPGELESIQATHQNLSLNVEKMSRLAEAGKLRSRRERDAFEKEKHNLAQMDIVLGKAENFSGFIPIRVFESGKRLNQTGPKKMVVESFAQDQRKLEAEVRNG
jgi:hypothetical protein